MRARVVITLQRARGVEERAREGSGWVECGRKSGGGERESARARDGHIVRADSRYSHSYQNNSARSCRLEGESRGFGLLSKPAHERHLPCPMPVGDHLFRRR